MLILYLKFYTKRELGEECWLNTVLLLLQIPILCREFWAFNFQKYPEAILIIGPFAGDYVDKLKNSLMQPEPHMETQSQAIWLQHPHSWPQYAVREDWTFWKYQPGPKWHKFIVIAAHTSLFACPSVSKLSLATALITIWCLALESILFPHLYTLHRDKVFSGQTSFKAGYRQRICNNNHI